MFNFRRKHHRQHQHSHENGHGCGRQPAPEIPDGCIPLSHVQENKRIIVLANSNIKTMEMGLYPGSMLTVIHNEIAERNIIVKIHDQRYVIPRDIANQIYVKI